MTSQRKRIRMSAEEVTEFLGGQWSMVLGTVSRDGRVHLVSMGYGLSGDDLVFTSYAKAQKVLNLRRNPRASCLIEVTGADYGAIRGVLLHGTVEMIESPQAVQDFMELVVQRMTHCGRSTREYESLNVAAVSEKRVAMRFRTDRVTSWNHAHLSSLD